MTPPIDSLGGRLSRLLQRMRTRGSIRRESLQIRAPGLAPRTATVFLPPGFQAGASAPLLVALDGQTMDRWRLIDALEEISEESWPLVPIVVAVPASAERLEEYGTAGTLDYAGRGTLAAAFQNHLVHGLLPTVRGRYGLRPDPTRTGIFGASMGGLCALDTAWRHPDVFGVAGIFSGSLWWRADNSEVAAKQDSRIMHARVKATERPPRLRLWFQAGTEDERDDRDGNGVIDAIQDTTELMDELRAKGYCDGTDMTYVQVPGGRHDEETWARVLPQFLRWGLGR